jgi:hypothetical protein
MRLRLTLALFSATAISIFAVPAAFAHSPSSASPARCHGGHALVSTGSGHATGRLGSAQSAWVLLHARGSGFKAFGGKPNVDPPEGGGTPQASITYAGCGPGGSAFARFAVHYGSGYTAWYGVDGYNNSVIISSVNFACPYNYCSPVIASSGTVPANVRVTRLDIYYSSAVSVIDWWCF